MSDQRERFEAWARGENHPLSESKIIGVGVTYKYATTEAAWRAWQAAQQHSEPDKSVTPPAVDWLR